MEKKTHPLALKKTELIWEGKYDAEGKRVAPLRVALLFQTVETVNESTQNLAILKTVFSGEFTCYHRVLLHGAASTCQKRV